jgi:hypothetical protein
MGPDLDLLVEQGLAAVYRAMPKAIIMAIISAIAVLVFTGSYWKASWISTSVLVLALFTTWRRYLEPLCLFAFVAAAFATCCEPGFLTRLQMLSLR